MIPLGIILVATFGAYRLGAGTGLAEGGLFGTAVATMGMLGTASYVLSMDAFSAVADNAGGLVEMTIARDRPDVRGRTMVLDSVGNTLKCLTKAYGNGAAALASLLLVAAYADEARRRAGLSGKGVAASSINLALDRPEIYLGALAGSCSCSGWRRGRSSASPGRGAASSTRLAGSSKTGRPASSPTTRPASRSSPAWPSAT